VKQALTSLQLKPMKFPPLSAPKKSHFFKCFPNIGNKKTFGFRRAEECRPAKVLADESCR